MSSEETVICPESLGHHGGRMKRKDAKPVRRKGSTHKSVAEEFKMSENEISRQIVTAAIEVHRTLGGPGLLESVYEEAISWELCQAGLTVQRQIELPITYKGNALASPLRIDLLVEGSVIVECKTTSHYNEIFEAQILTYLRLTKLKLGMVINFGERLVKDGIHRVVNDLKDE